MDSYQIPAKQATATLVEKKSEFIATIAPVETEEQALAILEQVRINHRTASRNVYAYVLREGARQRYSDDGEPAKTAGLPVLSVITHAQLTNCIIVVTRYFGGTLLGTGGLVRAYTGAAKAAVEAAGAAVIRQLATLHFTVDYAQYEPARRLLETAGAKVAEPQFTQQVQLLATLPAEDAAGVTASLNELLRGSVAIDAGEPFYAPF